MTSWERSAALSSVFEPRASNQSNLQIILDHLNQLGYAVAVHKLRADDFGLPQRRVRLYFIGVRDTGFMAESKEEVLARIPGRLQSQMCSKTHTPAT